MFIYDGVDIIFKHDDTVDVNNLLLVPNPNHASADIASNDNINNNIIIDIINFDILIAYNDKVNQSINSLH